MQRALEMGRSTDQISYGAVVTYSYNAIAHRVLTADEAALTEIGEALQMAERSAEDISLVLIRMTMGFALAELILETPTEDTTCSQGSAKRASRKSTH